MPDLFRGAVWAGPVYCIFYGPASTVAAFALGDSPSQLWFLLALFWMFALIELMWRIRPALLRKWQTLLAPAAASSTAGGCSRGGFEGPAVRLETCGSACASVGLRAC